MGAVSYTLWPIPMDEAGSIDIRVPGEYAVFQDAKRQDGSQELDAFLRIKIGTDGVDAPVFRLNSKIDGAFDALRVSWDATPGVTAYIYIARGPGLLRIEAPPPKQIVSTAFGSSLATAAVTVGTSATLLAAANSARQSVLIQNNGTADIYVGGASVTTANGIKVEAGGSVAIDKTSAAVYGIAASNQNARVMTEAS